MTAHAAFGHDKPNEKEKKPRATIAQPKHMKQTIDARMDTEAHYVKKGHNQ